MRSWRLAIPIALLTLLVPSAAAAESISAIESAHPHPALIQVFLTLKPDEECEPNGGSNGCLGVVWLEVGARVLGIDACVGIQKGSPYTGCRGSTLLNGGAVGPVEIEIVRTPSTR